jgi:hypothetical protein
VVDSMTARGSCQQRRTDAIVCGCGGPHPFIAGCCVVNLPLPPWQNQTCPAVQNDQLDDGKMCCLGFRTQRRVWLPQRPLRPVPCRQRANLFSVQDGEPYNDAPPPRGGYACGAATLPPPHCGPQLLAASRRHCRHAYRALCLQARLLALLVAHVRRRWEEGSRVLVSLCLPM